MHALKLLAPLILLSACMGSSEAQLMSPLGGGSGASGSEPAAPGDPLPAVIANLEYAPATTRRLTVTEIGHALSDVFLQGRPAPLARFIEEGEAHVFDNRDAYLSVATGFLVPLQETAEAVGQLATADLPLLFGCDTPSVGEEGCARRFISEFGLRTWRTPLSETDVDTLFTEVYLPAREGSDYRTGLSTVIEALILSPRFILRTELGEEGATGEVVRLSPYELASALSFGLWRSVPDEALLEAAHSESLSKPDELRAQARRMLYDARARKTLRTFFFQWLELKDAQNIMKQHPSFGATTAKSMQAEAERFLEENLWNDVGRLSSLLTSPRTFANADLATLYGLGGSFTDTLAPVTLDPVQRAGILTQPAFIASHTPPIGFSPIQLGLLVRSKLLCDPLPAPPPGVLTQLPSAETSSTRERFEPLVQNASCSGCHSMMNPVGFGFEQYGTVGKFERFEETPSGRVALSGEGELTATDVDGTFSGAVELAHKLARSRQVHECAAAHVLEFLLGRAAASKAARLPADEAALKQVVTDDFENLRFQDLIVELVASPAFTLRAAPLPPTGATP